MFETIKARKAQHMTRDELNMLYHWCYGQTCALFDYVKVQGILNVYHASRAWEDFQSWQSEEPRKAELAYRRCIRGHLTPDAPDYVKHPSPI